MTTEQFSRRYRPASTGWFVSAITALALLTVGYLVVVSTPPLHPPAASPYVKVLITGGYGSGVHIGNGYVLTANHVVTAQHNVMVETENASKTYAEVLWANADVDVALLRVAPAAAVNIASVPLDCSPVTDGEFVTAHGSALEADFVSTAGRIVGRVGKISGWREAVYADMTILPGMSGGAVIGPSGGVNGIAIGVMASDVQTGVGAIGVAPSGIGVVVPASSICALMDRH